MTLNDSSGLPSRKPGFISLCFFRGYMYFRGCFFNFIIPSETAGSKIMQAVFHDVQKLHSGALTSQTRLAASALFDRPFTLISEICHDETAIDRRDQSLDDERSDADTDHENSISQIEKYPSQSKL